jgi:hypothetical protein
LGLYFLKFYVAKVLGLIGLINDEGERGGREKTEVKVVRFDPALDLTGPDFDMDRKPSDGSMDSDQGIELSDEKLRKGSVNSV